MSKHLAVRACVILFSPLLLAAAAEGEEETYLDPLTVSVPDAIACKLDAPTYNTMAWNMDSDESGWKARGWKKIRNGNPFLNEYEMTEAVSVAGYQTKRVAFAANAIMAVIDLADPTALAEAEGIENAADPAALLGAMGIKPEQAGGMARPRRFLGERILHASQERDEALKLTFKTEIKRTISTVSSHPGKTLYGCAYKIEMEDFAEASAPVP